MAFSGITTYYTFRNTRAAGSSNGYGGFLPTDVSGSAHLLPLVIAPLPNLVVVCTSGRRFFVPKTILLCAVFACFVGAVGSSFAKVIQPSTLQGHAFFWSFVIIRSDNLCGERAMSILLPKNPNSRSGASFSQPYRLGYLGGLFSK